MDNMDFFPTPGDTARAIRVLKEISAICARERIVIAHQGAGIVFATAPVDLAATSVIVGVAKLIAPDCYEWAPMECNNPLNMKTGPWKTDRAN